MPVSRPRIDRYGTRYQIASDGASFAIMDTLSGLCMARSINQQAAEKKARELNRFAFMREAGIIDITKPEPKSKPKLNPKPNPLPDAKPKSEPHGKCWSKFGTINTDSPSPVQASIPNWGLKIKLRAKDIE